MSFQKRAKRLTFGITMKKDIYKLVSKHSPALSSSIGINFDGRHLPAMQLNPERLFQC